MTVSEYVPLRTLTTFKVGGNARYVLTCESVQDVVEARDFVRLHSLPYRVLGTGSNVLAHDKDYEGTILLMQIPGLSFESSHLQERARVGAGVQWETLVDEVVARGLWGIENLAGIPGTVGASPVQNIGAYGAELQHVFESCDVLDMDTGAITTYDIQACRFGYRDSVFKHNRALVILGVTFLFSHTPSPRLGYSDLLKLTQEGIDLNTPEEIAHAVRTVRSQKFPDLRTCGTAGSFFKNPVVTHEAFQVLTNRFGAMPSYPTEGGVKIPLAHILDHVLGLRGYRENHVYLYGNQPLVVVADTQATEKEIDTFACEIAKKVFDATSIVIEREVQSL